MGYFYQFSFSQSNFFEIVVFSILQTLGLRYTQQGTIANYLINCIIFQFSTILVMLFLKINQYIYKTIILFNIIAFAYSIYSGLFLQLLNSPHLINVVIYGIISLIFTIIITIALKYSKLPNVYVRKIFHIAPLVIFPIFDNNFSDIFQTSLIGVIYIFVVLEILRYFCCNKQELFVNLMTKVWEYMQQFLDVRDKFVWITHIHLLVGMSLTYFMDINKVIRSSSVIIPIGDAFAAIIGKKYGKIKIFDKSLQGTLSFIISSLLTFYIYSLVIQQSIDYWKLIISIVATSILQLFSKQIDNLLLPLFFSFLYINI